VHQYHKQVSPVCQGTLFPDTVSSPVGKRLCNAPISGTPVPVSEKSTPKIIAREKAHNSYPNSKNSQIYPHDPGHLPVVTGGGFFRHSSVRGSWKIAQPGHLTVVIFFRRKIQETRRFTTGTVQRFTGGSRQQGTFLFLKNTGNYNLDF